MNAPPALFINGIGVWGAGLNGWEHVRAVLRGESVFVAESPPLPSPALLPPAERRRSPGTARIAVHVAAQACTMAQVDPAALPSVFASSHGDTDITDYMCRELAAGASVSPTRFHNSVHNAASGYWTIAVRSTASASALTAGGDTFGAGLLEAAALAATARSPVVLAAYDLAAPAPLANVCPVSRSFGVALVLAPEASALSLACLRLRADVRSPAVASTLPPAAAVLMQASPAARCLPLLALLAREQPGSVDCPPCTWDIEPWTHA